MVGALDSMIWITVVIGQYLSLHKVLYCQIKYSDRGLTAMD